MREKIGATVANVTMSRTLRVVANSALPQEGSGPFRQPLAHLLVHFAPMQ
jgi:hypothetical protein